MMNTVKFLSELSHHDNFPESSSHSCWKTADVFAVLCLSFCWEVFQTAEDLFVSSCGQALYYLAFFVFSHFCIEFNLYLHQAS